MMKCLVLFLLPFIIQAKDDPDYWSDDFDEDKNCDREKEIMELRRETGPGRCASSSTGKTNLETRNYFVFLHILRPLGSKIMQWEDCKKKLAKLVVQTCSPLNILKESYLDFKT